MKSFLYQNVSFHNEPCQKEFLINAFCVSKHFWGIFLRNAPICPLNLLLITLLYIKVRGNDAQDPASENRIRLRRTKAGRVYGEH